ncbi:MAG: cell wall hydrolase [Sphingomonadales bacterium]|nr:cell wall hydrolase [Sphingomonadales bacterium]
MASPTADESRAARLPAPLPAAARHALLVLSALLAVAALWLARPPARERIDPAQITRLPARPADIEAHGGVAQSALAPDDARRRNDAVAFAPGPLIAARPFRFLGDGEDRRRAIECLAAAELYEAGDDPGGQAAVAQVVLNRVRHPAFPGTVCGVVLQGAERATGCQFTFTCDGALARAIPEPFWQRARAVATRALDGRVFPGVGWATHYHTRSVYPWWSPSLAKLARIGEHLFFRWPGGWGTPIAFSGVYRGGEPDPAPVLHRTAAGSAAPGAGEADSAAAAVAAGEEPPRPGFARVDLAPPAGVSAAALHGARIRLVHPDGGFFGLLVGPRAQPAKLVDAAKALCRAGGGPGGWCRVSAWGRETDIPPGFPIPPAARSRLVFEYVQASDTAEPRASLDCTFFAVAAAGAQCR